MWQLANCKNGVNSYEMHPATAISQKSVWFMLHRLRVAMKDDDGEKLTGIVEADETFVGGEVTKMHRRSKRKIQSVNDGNRGRGCCTWFAGNVWAGYAPREHPRAAIMTYTPTVLANVESGSTLTTDEFNLEGNLRFG